MKDTPDLMQIEAAYHALIEQQRTLQIACISENGDADIGNAAYLHHENRFYVLVSSLATHTANLLRTNQTAIMIHQPESEAVNVFAMQRLMLNCVVAEVSKETEAFASLLDIMHTRFGGIVDLLRSLPDFHLLEFIPQQGKFVGGFGQIFLIDPVTGRLNPLRVE